MAAGNLEVVQALFDAWFRGDEVAQSTLVHPEVVVTQFPEQVDARPYHGRAGMRDVVADWVGTWDDYSLEILAMREIGEHVLVSLHQAGRGKTSGARMEGDAWFVVTLHEGRVTRLQMFSSEDEALEACAPTAAGR
jgi:ketosteroid isomerase-like protein